MGLIYHNKITNLIPLNVHLSGGSSESGALHYLILNTLTTATG